MEETKLQFPMAAYHAIGRMIVGTANLEAFLFLAFGGLLDDDDLAGAILIKIDNISARWAIVLATAQLKPSHPISLPILEGEDIITRSLAMRNKLAHSLYGIGGEPEGLTLIRGALSTRHGSQKEEPLDLDPINEVSNELRDVVMSIAKACEGRTISPRKHR